MAVKEDMTAILSLSYILDFKFNCEVTKSLDSFSLTYYSSSHINYGNLADIDNSSDASATSL